MFFIALILSVSMSFAVVFALASVAVFSVTRRAAGRRARLMNHGGGGRRRGRNHRGRPLMAAAVAFPFVTSRHHHDWRSGCRSGCNGRELTAPFFAVHDFGSGLQSELFL